MLPSPTAEPWVSQVKRFWFCSSSFKSSIALIPHKKSLGIKILTVTVRKVFDLMQTQLQFLVLLFQSSPPNKLIKA